MKTIISLDIGTTVVKTVVFSLFGKELAVYEQPLSLIHPQEGHVEQDPKELLQACDQVLLQAIMSQDATGVLAISISAQGGSLVPADAEGVPTGNVVTWMDTRASQIVDKWEQDGVSSRLRRECGWAPQPGLPLSLIFWYKQYGKDLFEKTERWMSVNDFVVHHLTGDCITNLSCAAEMMLVDLETDNWSERISSWAGIKRDLLSEIRDSASIAGYLTSELKAKLGLDRELPVVNGGQDHSCEALALGVREKGTGMLACGTAWVLNVAMQDKDMNLVPATMDLNYHVIPDFYIASEFLGGYGKQIEWWVSDVASGLASEVDRDGLYKAFNSRLEGTVLGSSGALYDAQRGRFLDVGPGQDIGDLSRALLEGLTYQVHRSVDRLKGMGVDLKELWLIGGASRNVLLPQMIADGLGLEVRMTSYSHGPALGAAMLAMMALGEVENLGEARERFSLEERALKPEAGKHESYMSLFRRYEEKNRYE